MSPVIAGDNDGRSGGAVSGVAATNGQISFAMRRRALDAARPPASLTTRHLPPATSGLPADLRIRTEADHRHSRLGWSAIGQRGATRTACSDRMLSRSQSRVVTPRSKGGQLWTSDPLAAIQDNGVGKGADLADRFGMGVEHLEHGAAVIAVGVVVGALA